MKAIGFEDTCVIKRNLGSYDEHDNPLQEVVYLGNCYYQENGYANTQRMFVRNPILFLPEVSTLVETNDIVEITTKSGRKLNAVVAVPRDIQLPFSHDKVTRLELKQAFE